METPAKWKAYHCEDYFQSQWATTGHWDEAGQYWYFWPADRLQEDREKDLLVVGGPGVDGIDWGYRKNECGLWAYDPMRGSFVRLADTFSELVHGWLDGSITV